jgi:hypothetical protein
MRITHHFAFSLTNCIFSDFPFDKHLEDTFNIITYLRKSEHPDQDRLAWQKFVHRRAFRKLAHRVKFFNIRWGESPFNVMQTNLTKISSDHLLPKQFVFSRYKHLDSLLRELDLESTQKSNSKLVYHVDQHNVEVWVSFFKNSWEELVKMLLVPNGNSWNIKTEPPEKQVVTQIVQWILVFRKSREVIQHLFCLPSLDPIFKDARKFPLTLYCLLLIIIQKPRPRSGRNKATCLIRSEILS